MSIKQWLKSTLFYEVASVVRFFTKQIFFKTRIDHSSNAETFQSSCCTSCFELNSVKILIQIQKNKKANNALPYAMQANGIFPSRVHLTCAATVSLRSLPGPDFPPNDSCHTLKQSMKFSMWSSNQKALTSSDNWFYDSCPTPQKHAPTWAHIKKSILQSLLSLSTSSEVDQAIKIQKQGLTSLGLPFLSEALLCNELWLMFSHEKIA